MNLVYLKGYSVTIQQNQDCATLTIFDDAMAHLLIGYSLILSLFKFVVVEVHFSPSVVNL